MTLIYAHHAGAPEQTVEQAYLRDEFAETISRVDSSRGGYVIERDAEGNVKREHRAKPHQCHTPESRAACGVA